MADSSPLTGLLDRAGHVFDLAWQLGRAFQEERGTGGGLREIDPTSSGRHQPAFNKFCNAVLDLRDTMQNPPDGFGPVAQALLKAAGVAKTIRDTMQTADGQTWAAFLDFFPQLNSVAAAGREAIKEVTKARRADDPFAFVDQAAAGKGSGIDTTPALPRPPADVPLDQSTMATGEAMLAHVNSLAAVNTVVRQMVVDLGARHSGGAAPGTNQTEAALTGNPAGRPPKRSTERGEGRAKLIAGLTKHHQYADGCCLNMEPIGNNQLATAAGVSPSTASAFFNDKFQGHTKYKALCRNSVKLVAALKLLNDEFAPYHLLGDSSSNLAAPEKEDTDAQ
jgi:hypothetical protein